MRWTDKDGPWVDDDKDWGLLGYNGGSMGVRREMGRDNERELPTGGSGVFELFDNRSDDDDPMVEAPPPSSDSRLFLALLL